MDLKTFVIKFGADTKPLFQGLQSANNATNNFIASASKLLGGLAIGNMVKNMTLNFVELGNTLNQVSQSTGISVETFSSLGMALEQFGGNTNTAVSSLQSLNSSLEQAKWGQGALLEVSKKYGLQLFNQNGSLKSAEGLLSSIAGTMQGYSKATQIEIGKSLGLDDSMINLLQKGNSEIVKLMNNAKGLGAITGADAKIMADFKVQMIELKQLFNAIGLALVKVILPPMKYFLDVIKSVTNYFKENRRIATIALIAIGAALTPLLVMMAKMAVATAVAFAPLLIAVGICVAIALIVEDIVAYFQGADSVTGNLVRKFPLLQKPLEIIKSLVLGIWEVIKLLGDAILNFSFARWLDDLKVLKEFLISLFPEWLLKLFNAGSDVGNIPAPAVIPNQQITNSSSNANNNVTINNNINTNNPSVINTTNTNQIQKALQTSLQATS